MKEINGKINRHKQVSLSRLDKFNLIEGALSGTTGGALIGAPFGIIGSVIGSIIGGFFTGYSSYRDELKKISYQKLGKR